MHEPFGLGLDDPDLKRKLLQLSWIEGGEGRAQANRCAPDSEGPMGPKEKGPLGTQRPKFELTPVCETCRGAAL